MFYTTMEAIRKLNDLGEGEVKPRQTLLVVQKTAGVTEQKNSKSAA